MRNKTIKFAAIALLSVFALTACDDDIIAKPAGYGGDSPIVNIDGFNGTVYNNNFTDIYDSIRSGNIPSDVLDLLLYQYAMSVFGNYNKVTAATVTNNSFGEITLKQAVASLKGDKADAKAGLKPGTLPARFFESLISDLIYTPVISLCMVAFAYFQLKRAAAFVPEMVVPPFFAMFLKSLLFTFAAGYVLIFIFQPLFMKMLMKKFGLINGPK